MGRGARGVDGGRGLVAHAALDLIQFSAEVRSSNCTNPFHTLDPALSLVKTCSQLYYQVPELIDPLGELVPLPCGVVDPVRGPVQLGLVQF